jgi:hypothetical protein
VFANAEVFSVCATGELVELTEPSEVVDLLLQLMSLREPPNLKSLDFETLAMLAEAVEKYDVFHSKSTCRMYMQYVNLCFCEKNGTLKYCRASIPDHAAEVLKYAVKHGYAKVADDAAFCSIDYEVNEMAKHLTPEAFLAWVCLPSSARKWF